jgi:hypothetical protein
MVATNDQTRLINDARLRLTGAFDNVIQQELFAVTDEFLKFTNIWTQLLPFLTVPNQNTYVVTPAYPSVTINRLMYVMNSSLLPVAGGGMAIPGRLVFTPILSTSDTFMAAVGLNAVDPVDANNYPLIPSWITTKYRTDFLDGIFGKMMSQPVKTYTNEKMAIYHMRRWRQALSKAKKEVQHQNTMRGQAWFYPAAFASMSQRGGQGGFGLAGNNAPGNASLNRTNVTAPGTYNSAVTDMLIVIQAAVTSIVLQPSKLMLATGSNLIIVDAIGTFGTSPCTITVSNGALINGASSLVLSSNFQGVVLQALSNDGYAIL